MKRLQSFYEATSKRFFFSVKGLNLHSSETPLNYCKFPPKEDTGILFIYFQAKILCSKQLINRAVKASTWPVLARILELKYIVNLKISSLCRSINTLFMKFLITEKFVIPFHAFRLVTNASYSSRTLSRSLLLSYFSFKWL